MQKSILVVLAVGAIVGAMLPSGQPSPAPAAPQAVAVSGNAPRETRVQRQRNGHFYVDATVNGQHVRFLVDTGATPVALTAEDAQRVGEHFSPESFEIVGEGASGPVRGQPLTIDSIEVEGKRVENVRGAVLEGLTQSLLGQTYLSRMGSIEMRGDEMIIRPRA